MSKYDRVNNYTDDNKNILTDGEELLYNIKPKKSAFVFNKIATMMPFALLWLSFDSFFIITVLSTGGMGQMTWFLIPFFAFHLIPVWIWLGNIITANKRWKNTRYYVTDKRIVIVNGFIGEEYQSVYYKDITNVRLHIGVIDKMLNVGDIYFTLNNGMSSSACFLDIENVHEIYTKLQKIVLDIQTDIEYPNAYRPESNPGYNTHYDPKN